MTELEFKCGLLIATIELDKKYNLKDKVFRVQGYTEEIHKEKGMSVLDKWKIKGVGLIKKIFDVYPIDLKEGMKLT